MLSWGLGATVVAACVLSSVIGLRLFYQSKMRDTLSIMYMELERMAFGIEREARTTAANRALPIERNFLVGIDGTLVSTSAPAKGVHKLKDLGIDTLGDFRDLTIISLDGEDFLARLEPASEGRARLSLSKVKVANWIGSAARSSNETHLYVLTRQGSVLFSNTSLVTAHNYLKRPLVQKFIDAPLRLGQVEFTAPDGKDWLGFFYEIAGTNMIAFAEAPKSVALAPVRAALQRMILATLASVLGSLLLLQMILRVVTGPIDALIRWTREIASGVFSVHSHGSACREIYELSASFTNMSGSLAARDTQIRALMVEQTKKARLEAEIDLARTVQLRLLPQGELPRESGLDLAISYTPMTELAGDWYGYAHDPETGCTIVAIADISGHGVGSAMFMTLVAGAFEDVRHTHKGLPFVDLFLEKTNTLIKSVGRKAWHATMQVMHYDPRTRTLDIVNAGHPFALMRANPDTNQAAKFINLPSEIIGVDKVVTAKKTVQLEIGDTFVIYSDGLIEASSPAGRQFGRKRLSKVFNDTIASDSARDIADRITAGMKEHLDGAPPADDVCILVAKAV